MVAFQGVKGCDPSARPGQCRYFRVHKTNQPMNALNLIAGLAFACFATGTYAQGCSGHANAKGGGTSDMASISKELKLTAEQQEAFTAAIASCEKDCSAMASKGGDAKAITTAQSDRFTTAVTSMKTSLSPEQYKQLEAMHANGQLAGLCSSGKGCAKGAGKGGCCAGKAGAHHSTNSTPTIQ